eukprot:2496767-Prymnesium_polylepis.3
MAWRRRLGLEACDSGFGRRLGRRRWAALGWGPRARRAPVPIGRVPWARLAAVTARSGTPRA